MHSRSRLSRSCAFHCRGTEWSMRKWCISENISPVTKSRHSKQESQNLVFAARWTVLKSWTFIIRSRIYHSIPVIVHQFQRTFCHESIGLKRRSETSCIWAKSQTAWWRLPVTFFQNKIASSRPLLPKIAQPFLHYCQISLLNIVRTTYKQLHHIKAINFDIPSDSNNIVFLWLLHTVCSNPLVVINAWREWHQFLEFRHFSDKTVWIAFLHVWLILFYFWFNNFLLSLPIGKQKITGWRWAIYPKIQKTVVMLLFRNCLNRMKCYRLCSSRIYELTSWWYNNHLLCTPIEM